MTQAGPDFDAYFIYDDHQDASQPSHDADADHLGDDPYMNALHDEFETSDLAPMSTPKDFCANNFETTSSMCDHSFCHFGFNVLLMTCVARTMSRTMVQVAWRIRNKRCHLRCHLQRILSLGNTINVSLTTFYYNRQ